MGKRARDGNRSRCREGSPAAATAGVDHILRMEGGGRGEPGCEGEAFEELTTSVGDKSDDSSLAVSSSAVGIKKRI